MGRGETDSSRTHAPCFTWGSAELYTNGSQQGVSGMPAISKPQAQSLYVLTSQSIIFPARLQSLPLLKKKSSVPVSDPAGLSGPLKPLSLAPYSLSSLIWQPESDLPFLFLNSASMFSPACQYLTTLSSYITSPALNPSPSRARGCACSIQFNSTNLYQVPSIHSFQHMLSAYCIWHWGSRNKDLILRVELGRETRHYGMCYDVGSQNAGQPPIPAWQPRDGVNGTRESPKMITLKVTSPMGQARAGMTQGQGDLSFYRRAGLLTYISITGQVQNIKARLWIISCF